MTKTLTLKIPDNIYEVLVNTSVEIGQTPEELVFEWVEHRIAQIMSDPLLRMAGAFEFERNDLGDRHDGYLGQSVMANND